LEGRAPRARGAEGELGDRIMSALEKSPESREPAGRTPLMTLDGISQVFDTKAGPIRAVDNIDLSVNPGEVLCLVGESGCGKTTTARCILRAIEPTHGQILFRTESSGSADMLQLSPAELRGLRREMQMIFQHPFTSLNPRMTLLDIVGAPLPHAFKGRGPRGWPRRGWEHP
jgi:ABC-type glutathione transport system ATPase component